MLIPFIEFKTVCSLNELSISIKTYFLCLFPLAFMYNLISALVNGFCMHWNYSHSWNEDENVLKNFNCHRWIIFIGLVNGYRSDGMDMFNSVARCKTNKTNVPATRAPTDDESTQAKNKICISTLLSTKSTKRMISAKMWVGRFRIPKIKRNVQHLLLN